MHQADREKHNWTSVDAQAWREFISTATGKKLLRAIAEEKPPLLKKGDTNEIMIRSGEAACHDDIVAFLLTLTGADTELDDAPSQPSSYASLEDDNAWDGPKLTDPDNPNTEPQN